MLTKKLVLTSLVIGGSLSLTACGGGGSDTGPDPIHTSYSQEVKIPENLTFKNVTLSSVSSAKNNDLDGVAYNYRNSDNIVIKNMWNVKMDDNKDLTLTNFSTAQFVVTNEDQLKNLRTNPDHFCG